MDNTGLKELKAIIVDDEEPARVTLAKLLEWTAPNIRIVDACSGVDEALKAIRRHQPQLVFLDIEMPVKNGFDLLEEVGKVDFEVIFVTAYDQFAVEAFKRHALAYLLKPVDEEALKVVVERAHKQVATPINEEYLVNLFTSLRVINPKFNKIPIPTMDGLELVEVDEIVRCASDGNYTHLHFSTRPPMLISKTLKQVAEQLEPYSQFVRVHNSHLVNLCFVKRYQKGKDGYLILEDETAVPISRSRRDAVLSNF
jgi:two-component system LytT family response regulator